MNQADRPEAESVALPRELVELLGSQRARVKRRWFVHGLGIVLGLPVAAAMLF